MSLTATERELGLVEYHCDAHGFLSVTTPKASVICACGKFARRVRSGRLVDPDTLKPTKAKARELNEAGHPNIHACGDCGADFRGETLMRTHRTGRGSKTRCLTSKEMTGKGWRCDPEGRWRDPRNNRQLQQLHDSEGHPGASDAQGDAGQAPTPQDR